MWRQNEDIMSLENQGVFGLLKEVTCERVLHSVLDASDELIEIAAIFW
jgi:hypothetical protein